MNEIKKEERPRFFAMLFLGVPLLIAIFSGMAGIGVTPEKEFIYNFNAMYIALGLNVALWSIGLAYRLSDKKTQWSWFCLYIFNAILLPVLMGIPLLNLIYTSFPTWVVIAPLASMYLVVAFLPFVNERLAKILHTEIFMPQTSFGKVIQIAILALAPIAGLVGVFLSNLSERMSGLNGYALFGLMFHLLSVWGTASMVYQAWEHRPWAMGRRGKNGRN